MRPNVYTGLEAGMADGKVVTFRLNDAEAAVLAGVLGDGESAGTWAKRMALECAEGKRIPVVQRASDLIDGEPRTKPAPRPGIRHAAICPKCQTREFLRDAAAAKRWRCPEHGVGEVQANMPYFGQSTA